MKKRKMSISTLRRKLAALRHKFDKLVKTEDWDAVDMVHAEQKAIFKEATNSGLKIIEIQVADGYCFYFEKRRTKTLATFEWVYGCYISPWGKTVSVPIETANKLIRYYSI